MLKLHRKCFSNLKKLKWSELNINCTLGKFTKRKNKEKVKIYFSKESQYTEMAKYTKVSFI